MPLRSLSLHQDGERQLAVCHTVVNKVRKNSGEVRFDWCTAPSTLFGHCQIQFAWMEVHIRAHSTLGQQIFSVFFTLYFIVTMFAYPTFSNNNYPLASTKPLVTQPPPVESSVYVNLRANIVHLFCTATRTLIVYLVVTMDLSYSKTTKRMTTSSPIFPTGMY